MGLSPLLEREELSVDVEGFPDGDRTAIGLPAPQEELLKQLHALGKPVVLVLLNGSSLAGRLGGGEHSGHCRSVVSGRGRR